MTTHPCDSCPDALPGRFCAKYDNRSECAKYRKHNELEARNRRLERVFERQAGLVQMKLARVVKCDK